MEKLVLNPSTSALNVVDRDNLDKVLKMTLKQLVMKLLQVSGPFAKNAFILHNTKALVAGSSIEVSGNRKIQEFTKDGIGTLEQIEYASPIQRYIKDEVLTWVGQRVDAMCHDGTTTSMLFTASFLMYMLENRETFRFYNNSYIEAVYEDVTKEILKRLDEYKITVSGMYADLNNILKEENLQISEEQVRVMMATMQAATSSSGRKDVIDAVSKVVSHSPDTKEELLNINYITPKVETKEVGISAIQQECDFILPISLFDHTLLDTKTHEFNCDKADILLLREGLSRDTMTAQGLVNYLNEHKEMYKNTGNVFVLLVPSSGAGQLDLDWLLSLISSMKESDVTIFPAAYERPFNYNVNGAFWYYADALNGKADVPDVDELQIGSQDYITIEKSVIKNVKIHVTPYQMTFTDIIPILDRTTDTEKAKQVQEVVAKKAMELNIHPGELEPELYPHYTAAKLYFENQIKLYQSQKDGNYENIITDLRRALADMRVYRPWYINIMGKTHDVDMFKSIITDSAGAAMVALSDGVFFSGPSKLFTVLANMISDPEYPKDQISITLITCMIQAAKDMIYAMFGDNCWSFVNTFENILGFSSSKYGYVNASEGMSIIKQMNNMPFGYMHPDIKKEFILRHHIDLNQSPDLPFLIYVKSIFWPKMLGENDIIITPPCQVGNLFDVLFHRLREVTLRLVLTDNLIAPGTIWDDGSLTRK